MYRKLQRSVTALTATAAVFGLLLFAGGPPPQAMVQPDSMVAVGAGQLASDDTVAVDVDVDVETTDAATAANTRGHQRRSRAALALPYFSFAQGLRRVSGS